MTHIITLIIWTIFSLIIGILGKRRRFGLYGNFLVSFFFSPIVGVIVLLASDEKKTKEDPVKP
jgi:hypothetical protein